MCSGPVDEHHGKGCTEAGHKVDHDSYPRGIAKSEQGKYTSYHDKQRGTR